jgi:hypothetical protein
MTIVRCPRCRDEVSVPAKATSRALVRCPLCLEEYLLAEALANAPPPLVVIGGEVEQAEIEHPARDGDEYRLAGSRGPSAAAALHSATFPAAAGEMATLARRPAVRTLPRHRRQEKNGGGLLLAVNYVVGGVMGLALGLLVLWWGFRKDPLDLGPKIARYVPLIVPQPFRGKPESDDSAASSPRPAASADEAVAASGGGNNRRRQKQAASAEPKEPAAELQTLPGFDEPAKLPGAGLTPSIDAPALKDRGAAVELPANDLLQQLPQPAAAFSDVPATPSQGPPMPDLTDLLPDGPS